MRRLLFLTIVAAGTVALCAAAMAGERGVGASRALDEGEMAGTTGSWGACCWGVTTLNCPAITPTVCTCVGGGCGGQTVPTNGTYTSCYGNSATRRCRASHMTVCAHTWSCKITDRVYLTPCVPATGCSGSGLTYCDVCTRDTSIPPSVFTVWNATCG